MEAVLKGAFLRTLRPVLKSVSQRSIWPAFRPVSPALLQPILGSVLRPALHGALQTGNSESELHR
jgi:hypothetical protein